MIKLKLVLALAALALPGAIQAGTWCEPEPKCPVDCCEDNNGSITVGYDTAYLFYGVHVARDGIWSDVNYTLDVGGLDLNVGAWFYSSLGSPATDVYGDEIDVYASLSLPSICGFDHSIGYRHMFYPTTRLPVNSAFGDSQGEIIYTISRELFCGVTASFRAAYDYNVSDFQAQTPGQDRSGAWMHQLGLDKSIAINDCLSLDLSGGVFYSDNYWQQGPNAYVGNVNAGNTRDSGWNHYYITAGLPIAVGQCATLTPYIGYNGSPDSWIADGLTGVVGGNGSDVLYGGVSLGVTF